MRQRSLFVLLLALPAVVGSLANAVVTLETSNGGTDFDGCASVFVFAHFDDESSSDSAQTVSFNTEDTVLVRFTDIVVNNNNKKDDFFSDVYTVEDLCSKEVKVVSDYEGREEELDFDAAPCDVGGTMKIQLKITVETYGNADNYNRLRHNGFVIRVGGDECGGCSYSLNGKVTTTTTSHNYVPLGTDGSFKFPVTGTYAKNLQCSWDFLLVQREEARLEDKSVGYFSFAIDHLDLEACKGCDKLHAELDGDAIGVWDELAGNEAPEYPGFHAGNVLTFEFTSDGNNEHTGFEFSYQRGCMPVVFCAATTSEGCRHTVTDGYSALAFTDELPGSKARLRCQSGFRPTAAYECTANGDYIVVDNAASRDEPYCAYHQWFPEASTFTEAKAACEAIGGTLPQIFSAKSQEFVFSLTDYTSSVWSALKYDDATETWKWIPSIWVEETYAAFDGTKWVDSNGDDAGSNPWTEGHDLAVMACVAVTPDSEWEGVPCTATLPFVCQSCAPHCSTCDDVPANFGECEKCATGFSEVTSGFRKGQCADEKCDHPYGDGSDFEDGEYYGEEAANRLTVTFTNAWVHGSVATLTCPTGFELANDCPVPTPSFASYVCDTVSDDIAHLGCFMNNFNDPRGAIGTPWGEAIIAKALVNHELSAKTTSVDACRRFCTSTNEWTTATNDNPSSRFRHFAFLDGECVCVDDWTRITELKRTDACVPCEDDGQRECGGPNALSVYTLARQWRPLVDPEDFAAVLSAGNGCNPWESAYCKPKECSAPEGEFNLVTLAQQGFDNGIFTASENDWANAQLCDVNRLDNVCQCGCGHEDPDCTSNVIEACEVNACGGLAFVDPNDISRCKFHPIHPDPGSAVFGCDKDCVGLEFNHDCSSACDCDVGDYDCHYECGCCDSCGWGCNCVDFSYFEKTEGSTAYLVCNAGYELRVNGGALAERQVLEVPCKGGEWPSWTAMPTCEPRTTCAGAVPTPVNGLVTKADGVATVSCDSGYRFAYRKLLGERVLRDTDSTTYYYHDKSYGAGHIIHFEDDGLDHDYNIEFSTVQCAVVPPVPKNSCWEQVVANDAYCCYAEWDSICVAAYDSICGTPPPSRWRVAIYMTAYPRGGTGSYVDIYGDTYDDGARCYHDGCVKLDATGATRVPLENLGLDFSVAADILHVDYNAIGEVGNHGSFALSYQIVNPSPPADCGDVCADVEAGDDFDDRCARLLRDKCPSAWTTPSYATEAHVTCGAGPTEGMRWPAFSDEGLLLQDIECVADNACRDSCGGEGTTSCDGYAGCTLASGAKNDYTMCVAGVCRVYAGEDCDLPVFDGTATANCVCGDDKLGYSVLPLVDVVVADPQTATCLFGADAERAGSSPPAGHSQAPVGSSDPSCCTPRYASDLASSPTLGFCAAQECCFDNDKNNGEPFTDCGPGCPQSRGCYHDSSGTLIAALATLCGSSFCTCSCSDVCGTPATPVCSVATTEVWNAAGDAAVPRWHDPTNSYGEGVLDCDKTCVGGTCSGTSSCSTASSSCPSGDGWLIDTSDTGCGTNTCGCYCTGSGYESDRSKDPKGTDCRRDTNPCGFISSSPCAPFTGGAGAKCTPTFSGTTADNTFSCVCHADMEGDATNGGCYASTAQVATAAVGDPGSGCSWRATGASTAFLWDERDSLFFKTTLSPAKTQEGARTFCTDTLGGDVAAPFVASNSNHYGIPTTAQAAFDATNLLIAERAWQDGATEIWLGVRRDGNTGSATTDTWKRQKDGTVAYAITLPWDGTEPGNCVTTEADYCTSILAATDCGLCGTSTGSAGMCVKMYTDPRYDNFGTWFAADCSGTEVEDDVVCEIPSVVANGYPGQGSVATGSYNPDFSAFDGDEDVDVVCNFVVRIGTGHTLDVTVDGFEMMGSAGGSAGGYLKDHIGGTNWCTADECTDSAFDKTGPGLVYLRSMVTDKLLDDNLVLDLSWVVSLNPAPDSSLCDPIADDGFCCCGTGVEDPDCDAEGLCDGCNCLDYFGEGEEYCGSLLYKDCGTDLTCDRDSIFCSAWDADASASDQCRPPCWSSQTNDCGLDDALEEQVCVLDSDMPSLLDAVYFGFNDTLNEIFGFHHSGDCVGEYFGGNWAHSSVAPYDQYDQVFGLCNAATAACEEGTFTVKTSKATKVDLSSPGATYDETFETSTSDDIPVAADNTAVFATWSQTDGEWNGFPGYPDADVLSKTSITKHAATFTNAGASHTGHLLPTPSRFFYLKGDDSFVLLSTCASDNDVVLQVLSTEQDLGTITTTLTANQGVRAELYQNENNCPGELSSGEQAIFYARNDRWYIVVVANSRRFAGDVALFAQTVSWNPLMFNALGLLNSKDDGVYADNHEFAFLNGYDPTDMYPFTALETVGLHKYQGADNRVCGWVEAGATYGYSDASERKAFHTYHEPNSVDIDPWQHCDADVGCANEAECEYCHRFQWAFHLDDDYSAYVDSPCRVELDPAAAHIKGIEVEVDAGDSFLWTPKVHYHATEEAAPFGVCVRLDMHAYRQVPEEYPADEPISLPVPLGSFKLGAECFDLPDVAEKTWSLPQFAPTYLDRAAVMMCVEENDDGSVECEVPTGFVFRAHIFARHAPGDAWAPHSSTDEDPCPALSGEAASSFDYEGDTGLERAHVDSADLRIHFPQPTALEVMEGLRLGKPRTCAQQCEAGFAAAPATFEHGEWSDSDGCRALAVDAPAAFPHPDLASLVESLDRSALDRIAAAGGAELPFNPARSQPHTSGAVDRWFYADDEVEGNNLFDDCLAGNSWPEVRTSNYLFNQYVSTRQGERTEVTSGPTGPGGNNQFDFTNARDESIEFQPTTDCRVTSHHSFVHGDWVVNVFSTVDSDSDICDGHQFFAISNQAPGQRWSVSDDNKITFHPGAGTEALVTFETSGSNEVSDQNVRWYMDNQMGAACVFWASIPYYQSPFEWGMEADTFNRGTDREFMDINPTQRDAFTGCDEGTACGHKPQWSAQLGDYVTFSDTDLFVLAADTREAVSINDISGITWNDCRLKGGNCPVGDIDTVGFMGPNRLNDYSSSGAEADDYREGHTWRWSGCFAASGEGEYASGAACAYSDSECYERVRDVSEGCDRNSWSDFCAEVALEVCTRQTYQRSDEFSVAGFRVFVLRTLTTSSWEDEFDFYQYSFAGEFSYDDQWERGLTQQVIMVPDNVGAEAVATADPGARGINVVQGVPPGSRVYAFSFATAGNVGLTAVRRMVNVFLNEINPDSELPPKIPNCATFVGDVCTECKSGYTLTTSGACKPKGCAAPNATVAHSDGEFYCTGWGEGDVCDVVCDDGHVRRGALTCRGDSWVGTPRCNSLQGFADGVDYNTAKDACEDHGGFLATFTGLDDVELLLSNLGAFSSLANPFWTGLSKAYNGEPEWHSGWEYTLDFETWAPYGRDDVANATAGFCVSLRALPDEGLHWAIVDCDATLGFFCESCTKNCAECNADNECAKCVDGFTLEDGECTLIEKCPRGSSTFAPYCLCDKPGYYVDENWDGWNHETNTWSACPACEPNELCTANLRCTGPDHEGEICYGLEGEINDDGTIKSTACVKGAYVNDDNKCTVRECPAGSDNDGPDCNCNAAGYDGDAVWDGADDTRDWTHECTLWACPRGSSMPSPDCDCNKQGFVGEAEWDTNDRKWSHTCKAVDCPDGSRDRAPMCNCDAPGFVGEAEWSSSAGEWVHTCADFDACRNNTCAGAGDDEAVCVDQAPPSETFTCNCSAGFKRVGRTCAPSGSTSGSENVVRLAVECDLDSTEIRNAVARVLGIPAGSIDVIVEVVGDVSVVTLTFTGEVSVAADRAQRLEEGVRNDPNFIPGCTVRAFVGALRSTCSDKKQNGDEEGVDCGGSCNDCPSCLDEKMNGDEEDVDCGGSCDECAPDAGLVVAIIFIILVALALIGFAIYYYTNQPPKDPAAPPPAAAPTKELESEDEFAGKGPEGMTRGLASDSMESNDEFAGMGPEGMTRGLASDSAEASASASGSS